MRYITPRDVQPTPLRGVRTVAKGARVYRRRDSFTIIFATFKLSGDPALAAICFIAVAALALTSAFPIALTIAFVT
jgi:hypothetical protein